jgi:hypothetical protein
MRHVDVSEIIAGKVLDGSLLVSHVAANQLASPYDDMVKLLQDGTDRATIVDKIGFDPIRAASEAAKAVMLDDKTDWVAVLEKASGREQLAIELERHLKRLRKGEDADVGEILSFLHTYQDYGNAYITMDKTEAQAGIWRKTFYAPIDDYMGGIPEAGLTLIAAPPGVGKTSLLVKLSGLAARQGKKTLIHTLEMTNRQIKWRLMEMMSLSIEEQSHIISSDLMRDIDTIYADDCRIAAKDELHFIGIDFADMLCRQEQNESVMGHIYYTCAQLAKYTGVPVILICQFNREYTKTVGRPRMYHIRYSSAAEQAAAMVLVLYKPLHSDPRLDDILTPFDGRGYIIEEKARFSFLQGGPGAAMVDWDGKESWGDTVHQWFPL